MPAVSRPAPWTLRSLRAVRGMRRSTALFLALAGLLAAQLLVPGVRPVTRLQWISFVLGLGVLVMFAYTLYWVQRRLQEVSAALERAQRVSTVGLVTSGFAHEMKNALTVILGFAELARTASEKSGADAKVQRHLRELEGEVRRTVQSLGSFLAYARGEGEAAAPSARDANEIVRETLRWVRPMARMKELQLDDQLGEPPRIAADPFAVRQVLLNLLLNALDFAKTRIEVTTRGDGAWAEFRVADDGPGVPAEDREKIFERWFTTRPGGTGLGLATANEIVKHHRGTLVYEERAGGGAAFVLRLPAAARAQEAAAAPAATGTALSA
jgi:two-component system sensor histidine kinase PilS (NtrC family)